MNVIFQEQFTGIVQHIENLCAIGTKNFFKDRTIVFQSLVQDGGAIIFVHLNSALLERELYYALVCSLSE